MHSSDRQTVFQEVKRVLKSGGEFIFTEIREKAAQDLKRRWQIIDDALKDKPWLINDPIISSL